MFWFSVGNWVTRPWEFEAFLKLVSRTRSWCPAHAGAEEIYMSLIYLQVGRSMVQIIQLTESRQYKGSTYRENSG